MFLQLTFLEGLVNSVKKIVTVIGARPQFIKSGILSKSLRKEFDEILVHTGQHYDKNMSDVFFEEMNIKKPHYNLGVGSGTHAVQTANMMIEIEKVLIKEKPNAVLLYGDTNSTLSAGITAAKLHIPIFHIEAGVRTGIFDMPEEQNRIVTDHLSTLLFACTEISLDNLKKENLGEKSFNVGDVMYDALLHYSEIAEKKDKIDYFKDLKPLYDTNIAVLDEYCLATCHRPENTDYKGNFIEILEALNELTVPVLFSAHPRIRNLVNEFHNQYKNIIFVEPLSYFETLFFTKHAQLVVTDSGGLHKEAFLHRVPCVSILRNGWEETLQNNWNEFVRPSKEMILNSINKRRIDSVSNINAFGDGHSCDKIVKIIKEYFDKEK